MDYKGRKIKLALKQQLEEITFMAQTTHRSTSRVLDIFELLSTTSSDGATLTEIAQALESPKSSILPILQTLVARGYIDMDYRTNKYSIGLNLYMAASIYRSKISINKFIDIFVDIFSHFINISQLMSNIKKLLFTLKSPSKII